MFSLYTSVRPGKLQDNVSDYETEHLLIYIYIYIIINYALSILELDAEWPDLMEASLIKL